MRAPTETPARQRLEQLELKAKLIRERLLRVVDAIETRRHRISDAGHRALEAGQHAKQLAKPVAVSVLAIALLLGLAVLAAIDTVRARRRLSLPNRVSHAIQRLDLVRQPSLARRIFERFTLAVVTFVTTELTKRMSKNLVQGYVRAPIGEAR
jgi:hypothetical protein